MPITPVRVGGPRPLHPNAALQIAVLPEHKPLKLEYPRSGSFEPALG